MIKLIYGEYVEWGEKFVENYGLWKTRTHGSPWLGERNYKNGKLVLFIKVDFYIWHLAF